MSKTMKVVCLVSSFSTQEVLVCIHCKVAYVGDGDECTECGARLLYECGFCRTRFKGRLDMEYRFCSNCRVPLSRDTKEVNNDRGC